MHWKASLVTFGAWLILTPATSPALAQAPVQPSAAGQPAKAGSDWQHVRALPPATGIFVKATSGQLHCKLTEVTDDTVVCSHGKASTTFQRSEIQFVKTDHRGRSALIGGAIGGGGLGIAAFATTSGGSNDSFFGKNFLRGQATGVGLAVGAVVGGSIGALTDFSRSTVYKAP